MHVVSLLSSARAFPNIKRLLDVSFGVAVIRKATFCSRYWHPGTGMRRLLIRLVALFCLSKLVLLPLLFPPPPHLNPDGSVCVITILIPLV